MELNGKCGTAKVFTDVVEQSAITQIINLLNQPFAANSNLRMMPDVHAGAGCTIGTTMKITDKICPNLVGVDISCGMLVYKLNVKEIDFDKLDNTIRNFIPSGCSIRQSPYKSLSKKEINLPEKLRCADYLPKEVIARAKNSIGSLGGGNHFIEVDKDEEDNLYLVIHSGSRNLGKQVAEYYQSVAIKEQKEYRKEFLENTINTLKKSGMQDKIQKTIDAFNDRYPAVPDDLAYLEGDSFDDYMHDMNVMKDFAHSNRKCMADIICEKMRFEVTESFETLHNYIDVENKILRKGAVSALKDEKLLIPINMRDGSLICVGKGNPDWNYSAPHGAGRLMSRSQAKKEIPLDLYEESMRGIYTTSVNSSTIDESPFAYKNIEDIVNNIGPTVDIICNIKPIYNFKAGE